MDFKAMFSSLWNYLNIPFDFGNGFVWKEVYIFYFALLWFIIREVMKMLNGGGKDD